LKTAIIDIGKRKNRWFANKLLFHFELVSALQSTIEISRYPTILILHFHNHWNKTGYSFWLSKIETNKNRLSSNTNNAKASQVNDTSVDTLHYLFKRNITNPAKIKFGMRIYFTITKCWLNIIQYWF